MDVLKKQKAMVVESMKSLYKTIHNITGAVAQATDVLNTGGGTKIATEMVRSACAVENEGQNAWSPAIVDLGEKLELLLNAKSHP